VKKVVKMKLQDAILTSFTLFSPPCSAILLGWSDPVGRFGHSTVPKSGVAPAQHGVLPASKSKAAPCATHMLPTTSRHPRGDANGDAKGDMPCLLDRHHATPAAASKAFENIETPTNTEAQKNKNVRKNIGTSTFFQTRLENPPQGGEERQLARLAAHSFRDA